MNKILTFLFSSIFMFGLCAFAQAAVIEFDDLMTNPYVAPIPENYGIISSALDLSVFDNNYFMGVHKNTFNPPSGGYAVFNLKGTAEKLFFSELINFNGAFFAGFGFQDRIGLWGDLGDYGEKNQDPFTATTITVIGYNGSNEVGSASMDLSPSSYQWLSVNFNGLIDSIQIIPSIIINNQEIDTNRSYWIMDNFTYNENLNIVPVDVAPVPEPATMLLFGTGMIGIAGLRRKQKKS